MTGRSANTARQALATAAIGQVLALALMSQPLFAQDARDGVDATAEAVPSAQVVANGSANNSEAPDGADAQRITEYLGGGYLALSEECEAHGWSGTHQILIRTQPQGMRGNPEDETQMALFFATGVVAFRFDHEDETRTEGAPVTEATYVWNGPWSPEIPTMTISYRSRYGSHIPDGGSNLDSVLLTLGNFNELDGCVATMRVSMGRN